ncbi:putative guanylyltransferase [Encephalitozoon cuniculi]|uniref:Uncharacterized protein n=1 Tax=Encephalitozoon cuniculi TaxID=6035 RepID=M1K955_ENCCN|nr:hypothetical protein ECU07_1560 [Encephalitozoon cuniculi]UYI27317.1 putative guanylyltransferase [Encephalitozoon cuniculi]
MRTVHRVSVIRAIYLLLVYKCTTVLCQEDESTVEIVLFSNGAEKIKGRSDAKKDADSEDRSKTLKSLVTTLVNHLLAGNKLKNGLLRSYRGSDLLSASKGAQDTPEASKGEGVSKSAGQPVQEPTPELLEKIKRIPIGYRTFCSFLQNLDLIRDKLKNRPGIRKIQNILVYEGYHLTDYWGRLKFKKEGDKLVDETGYFEGIRINGFEEMLNQGKMTKTGFVQKKDVGENEINENLITMKLLLNEIAKEKNTPIHDVINEKCNLSIVEELAFYGSSPSAHSDEIVHVCICSDSFCKEPCKNVVAMKAGELEFKD